MKLKKFISSALALSTIVTSLSAVNVFAADPTFTVGAPVDALTGEEVTEFTAGQIIELPIDVNTDSGKMANIQIRVYYDNTILQAGIDSTYEGTDGYTYWETYQNVVAADPSNEYIICGRNNIQGRTKGAISGNSFAGDDLAITSWNITGANTLSVSDSVPEFYVPFTVKSDFDASEHSLNAGTNSLNNDGIFGVEAEIAETVGTAAVRAGEQKSVKANACDGAFQIVYDTTKLAGMNTEQAEGNGYYVQKVEAVIDGVRYDLNGYVNEEGTAVYSFPVRLTSAADDASVNVEIIATVTDDENGTINSREMTWGTVNVDMSGTVSSYAENSSNALN